MQFAKINRKERLIIVLGISTIVFLMSVNMVGTVSGSTNYDLTGVWNCDDGGIYYLHQTGNHLGWYGEQAPNNPVFSNVVQGTISSNTINLQWVDVPKGATLNNGVLILNIVSNNELQATEKTGGFSGSHWTRSGMTPVPVGSPVDTSVPTTNPTPNTTPVETPTFVILGGSR